ncbi:TonB-dependent receptor [Pedobacter sp. SD-b]|uniref:TonB-dependent receptor n=1 Tax=Pedobacter segetis TaxID=2793069 RepID=A0ABS1BJX8_9SPHI|nr:TonB-dependent receptor [Pedobacter segetis]MBK0383061.1 TonB-dependent receptor [Pedobacter segetis]
MNFYSKKLYLSLLLSMGFWLYGFAQKDNIIKGKVLDAYDKSALPGVSVNEVGSNNGIQTDLNGEFSISLKTSDPSLKFSFLGYETQTIKVQGKATITLELKPSAKELNQVVVVGYGSQKKANLTGAVASVNMDDIQGVPISNAATALQGRLPGVTISAFSNQPGKNDPQIRIRGVGTLGNNDPLVVIDGVPSDVGALGNLSPDDIESISVLKDASSASIYGVRAGNGVILVNTKRGQAGKPTVQFRETQAIQTALLKPSYMDGFTWASTFNDYQVETGAAPVYTPDMLQKLKDGSDPNHFGNTDWFDEVYRPASFQNHYFSASGGSEQSKYLVSAEYQKQDGLMVNTGSDRMQLRTNLDNKISNAISFGLNLRGYKEKIKEPVFSASGNSGPGDNGINRQISGFTRPTVPIRYSFGEYGSRDGSTLGGIKNPLQALNEQSYGTDNYHLDGKLFAEVKFLKDFSFTTSLAAVYENSKEVQFIPSLNTYGPDDELLALGGLNTLYNSSATFTRYINENLLRYNKKIGKHDIKVLLGHTLQHDANENFNAGVVNLPSNNIRVIGASSEQPTNGGGANALSLQSFLGRINYVYADKYLFEVSGRIDGSSRLPQSQQYPLFPSVSAGWVLSEEPFLKNNKIISFLKLRGSYGELGNQDIGNYAYSQNYNVGQDYVFNGTLVQGAAITNLANPNIKWETTKMSNVGLDAELLNGKLSLVAEYFYRNTSDILFSLPIPNTLGGLGAPPQNTAKVNNKGFEITLNHQNKIGKFTYNVGVNGSFIKNKVVSLADQDQVINGSTILKPGYAIDSYYGYISTGIIRTPEQLAAAPAGLGTVPLRLGDIAYKDMDGDNKITTADRVIIGNQFPKLSYGINLGGAYKGFDLNVFLQGIAGINRYYNDPVSMGFRQQKLNMWTQRYTPINTDGVLPRFGNPTNNNPISTFGASESFGFKDASYLRLKNLEFGYSFSVKSISKIGLSKARLYFSGVNLFTWSGVKNYDVEKGGTDNSSYGYVNTKNYALGLSLTF